MTAPDAIERAQGWLRAVKANRPSFVSDPVRRAREGLARLGPPSVGLAVALRDILGEEDAWTGVSESVLERADTALATWRESVHDGADGA